MLQQLSRSDGSDAGAGGRTCAVRSILVHVQDDRALVQRLEAALSLARACGAHLHCVHITPVEAYVAFDGFGGVFVMNDVITALDEGEDRIRAEGPTRDAAWWAAVGQAQGVGMFGACAW